MNVRIYYLACRLNQECSRVFVWSCVVVPGALERFSGAWRGSDNISVISLKTEYGVADTEGSKLALGCPVNCSLLWCKAWPCLVKHSEVVT